MKLKEQKKAHVFWRVLDWFSPSFTELHAFVMFSIIIALIAIDKNVRYQFTHFSDQGSIALVMLFVFMLIFIPVIVVNLRLENNTKANLVIVYYAFIAVMAGISLAHQTAAGHDLTNFKQANLYFVWALFVAAILRFLIVWLFTDGHNAGNDKFIAQNLKDDQYRYPAFIGAFVITFSVAVWLGRMYESAATVAVLTFGYVGILLSLLDYLFGPRLLLSQLPKEPKKKKVTHSRP